MVLLLVRMLNKAYFNYFKDAIDCIFNNLGNYPQMQELHRKYASQGLAVLAFPSNQVKLHFKEI